MAVIVIDNMSRKIEPKCRCFSTTEKPNPNVACNLAHELFQPESKFTIMLFKFTCFFGVK